jgi:hypothetical protein
VKSLRFSIILGVLAITAPFALVAVISGRADASVSVSDLADANIKSATPKVNYGSSQEVTLDAQPNSYGYFKFSVSIPAGQTLTRAVFRCWAGSSNSQGAQLRPVTNAWAENTITWANAPMPELTAPPLAVTGPVTARTWAHADLTSAVSGSGSYSFVLTTDSATAWSCASRENVGQHPPSLDVTTATTTSSPPTTTSSAPSAPASPAPSTSSSTSSGSTSSAASAATSAPAQASTSSSVAAAPATHPSLSLPARGTFYYPWFPEAWNQSGYDPATHYQPSLGYYATVSVLSSHVRSMIYGGFKFAASSWWGQSSKEDARIGPLLTAAHGTSLEVAPYYEAEGNTISGVAGSPNPTPAQITADLKYLAAHYISDPNYLWIAGKPTIFVYGDPSDSCATATRWAQANAAASTHFYVVLKVVSGYQNCADQPDNWHQYGPASATDSQGTHSYTISPGFDKFTEGSPRLARDPALWAQDVQAMNCSSAAFKLVTTFNEWGEGTSVESAGQWSSSSGQGTYLDTLHDDQTS